MSGSPAFERRPTVLHRNGIDVAAAKPTRHVRGRNPTGHERIRSSQQERPGATRGIDDQLGETIQMIERQVDQRPGELRRGRVRPQRTTIRRGLRSGVSRNDLTGVFRAGVTRVDAGRS